jgi:hypothetical protein
VVVINEVNFPQLHFFIIFQGDKGEKSGSLHQMGQISPFLTVYLTPIRGIIWPGKKLLSLIFKVLGHGVQ